MGKGNGFVILMGIILIAVGTGGLFSSLPTQGWPKSTGYSSPVDYSFNVNCEDVDPLLTGFALTGIPKDAYDRGLDPAKSYAKTTLISVFDSGNQIFLGRTGQASVSYVTLGENPYAVLQGSGTNTYGWVYAVNLNGAPIDLNSQSDGRRVPGMCRIDYHLEFVASTAPEPEPEQPVEDVESQQPVAGEPPVIQDPTEQNQAIIQDEQINPLMLLGAILVVIGILI